MVSAGERGSEMFFIASGVVEVRGRGDPVQLSNGDFFGEPALFVNYWRRSADIVSLGFCRLLTLSRRDFEKLANKDPEIETVIRKAAEAELPKRFPEIPLRLQSLRKH